MEDEMLTSPGRKSPRGRRPFSASRGTRRISRRQQEDEEDIQEINENKDGSDDEEENNIQQLESVEDDDKKEIREGRRGSLSRSTAAKPNPSPAPRKMSSASRSMPEPPPIETAASRVRRRLTERNTQQEAEEIQPESTKEDGTKEKPKVEPIGKSVKEVDVAPKANVIVKEPSSNPSSFMLVISGQIESCQFPGNDQLCCKYNFVYGDDWNYISGIESGITQYAASSLTYAENKTMVWNFPLELSLKSTNAHGWPQIAVSVYGSDFVGREVIRGYGATRLPIAQGTFVRYIRLFRPIYSNYLQEVISVLTGQRTEYNDPKFVCRAEGRKVTRVVSAGIIKVQFTIMTKGMSKFGFTEEPYGVSAPVIY